MKNKKVIMITGSIVILLVLIAGVALGIYKVHENQKMENKEVVYELPAILPLSGEIYYLGESAKWAIDYAVDEINAAGGINGIPVHTTFYDSEFNKNRSKDIVEKLVKTQRFLIGPVDSNGTAAIADIIRESGTPDVATYSFESVREQSAPYGISYMSDSTTGEIAAIDIWKELNPDIEKVVIVINKGESSQMETADLLQDKLTELDMKLLRVIEIDAALNNGLNAVVEALNTNADGYIILARTENYVKFVAEMRQRGITDGRRFTASFAGYEIPLIQEYREQLSGTYIWNKFDCDYKGEEWQKLLAAYKKNHDGNVPGSCIVSEMYNVVYAWKACIEELNLSPEVLNLKEEKKSIADWFYNSSVQHGIQGDYQWIRGNKLTSVYYFKINDEGIPKRVEMPVY